MPFFSPVACPSGGVEEKEEDMREEGGDRLVAWKPLFLSEGGRQRRRAG
jgi:hypothetical protein